MRLNSKFTGYIPAQLKYVQRPPRKVVDYWEHDMWENDKPTGVMVAEAFVVDASNPRTLKTAMTWAQGYGAERKAKVTELPNDPIASLEIVSLDIRSEGGRAWKALINGKYYVDLREDVLLDSLRNGEGVTKAELSGPFVWGCVGSHMKLMRVGSRLHEAVVEAGKRRASADVKGSALEIGGVYENRKGEKFVYLGQVDGENYELTNEEDRYKYTGYGAKDTYIPHFKLSEERDMQLWCGFPSYWKSFQDFFKIDASERRHGSAGTQLMYAKTVKKKAVVGKTSTVKVPDNVIEVVRDMALAEVRASIAFEKKSREKSSTFDLAIGFAYNAWACSLRPAGADKVAIPELQPLYDHVAKYPDRIPFKYNP